MALLIRIILVMMVLVAGCYSPELEDCVVTCTSSEECGGDLVCTPKGLCAASGDACNATTTGGPMIELRITVMGEGSVEVDGVGVCDPSSSGPMGETCILAAPAGSLSLEAIPGEDDKPFEKWTSIVCAGQDESCEVTLVIGAMISAKFK